MPPINSPRNICDQISESARDQMPYVLNDDLSQFETLSQTEQLEQQKLKVLECELNELFEMTKDMKKQNYELHKKRLSDIFQKSESEKIEAYRKLDFIRRQLIELEAKQGEQTTNSSAANSSAANWNECDSGFSSKSENDRDAKMLEGVRKRIQKLNDCSFELKKKVQQLEIENNELLSKLQMEQSFVQRNSETLKQVADLLCNMTGEQFSYNDIYNVQNNGNPFCDAILRLEHTRRQREEQLCQNVDKLQECLFNNEKEMISLEQRLNAKDVGTDAFKCQIEQLQCTIYEKENRIKQLNTMLNRLSHLRVESPSGQQHQLQQQSGTSQQQHQHGDQQSTHQQCELKMLQEKIEQLKCRNKKLCEDLENSQKQEHFLHTETRKLNDELTDSKRRNNELNMQTRRLTNLLKQQECHREEVTQKYQMIERNYEDQAKKLRHAHAQIKQLQDRFCMMEKLNDEHHMERNLLREEVLALKEKEACLLGKHKSIQEQLKKAEHEVFTAHEIIKEQQCIMQRNEVAHQESVKQLQEQSNETKRHFNIVVEDYNCLQEEYEKQNELRRQNEKVIESFRKWKEAQLKSDEATRASFKQYEEHIRLLLEEKQQFLEKYRDLNRDFCIMKNEVDRLHGVSDADLRNNSDNSLETRMELIRRTSRRISMQTNSLRSAEGSTDLHMSRSRSVTDLCM